MEDFAVDRRTRRAGRDERLGGWLGSEGDWADKAPAASTKVRGKIDRTRSTGRSYEPFMVWPVERRSGRFLSMCVSNAGSRWLPSRRLRPMMRARGTYGAQMVGSVLSALAAALLAACPAQAELDLKRAEVSRLPNGLTVILLEDHSFPVVSVQTLYKSGSRDETAGKTGLAHFLEHLAFRASENFPNAARDGSDLRRRRRMARLHLARPDHLFCDHAGRRASICFCGSRADRMARVTIDPASIAAEKGAVITEMHGYENDPASVLLDAVTATALQAHPYRNNTIGYESDVAALTAGGCQGLLRGSITRRPMPCWRSSATFDPTAGKGRWSRGISRRCPRGQRRSASRRSSRSNAGERRTHAASARRSAIFPDRLSRLPPASSPDFPAFLVLQQLLSGGSGVNFRQNDWGTPAVAGLAAPRGRRRPCELVRPDRRPLHFHDQGLARRRSRSGSSRARDWTGGSTLVARRATLRGAACRSKGCGGAPARRGCRRRPKTQRTSSPSSKGSAPTTCSLNLPDQVAAVTAAQVQQVGADLSRAPIAHDRLVRSRNSLPSRTPGLASRCRHPRLSARAIPREQAATAHAAAASPADGRRCRRSSRPARLSPTVYGRAAYDGAGKGRASRRATCRGSADHRVRAPPPTSPGLDRRGGEGSCQSRARAAGDRRATTPKRGIEQMIANGNRSVRRYGRPRGQWPRSSAARSTPERRVCRA